MISLETEHVIQTFLHHPPLFACMANFDNKNQWLSAQRSCVVVTILGFTKATWTHSLFQSQVPQRSNEIRRPLGPATIKV